MWSSGRPGDRRQSSGLICRDFQRNVCDRGSSCKYRHVKEGEDQSAQSKIVFCHDYQNRGACSRANCRFIHCKREEEDEYKESGYLPPHVREQVIQNGFGAETSSDNGGEIPICKDFLKNGCNRPKCKFRHTKPQQQQHYDDNNGKFFDRKPQENFSFGVMAFDRRDSLGTGTHDNFDRLPQQQQDFRGMGRLDYDEPSDKKRRIDLVVDYGHNVNIDVLSHENMILKQQMQELKNKVNELSTTNNFLLEQNAQLRISLKAATGDSGGQAGQQVPGNQQPQNQAPVVSMEMPSGAVDQGLTMTVAVANPSSMAPQPMSMSLPVAQLVTTMAGSPIVTSISMAPTQPATLVTSMSLAPTIATAQPIMTSINLAEAMESGQMPPPPSLALQALSGPPTSIHAVPQALPPPQTMLAPNNVQVHETRLISYPIMSVRPRL